VVIAAFKPTPYSPGYAFEGLFIGGVSAIEAILVL
jgi:hypothetical protein